MPESFFILSKEHLDVAVDEVISLARTYDKFAKVKSYSNIVMVQSKTDWQKIAQRAAFVQISGQILHKMSGLFLDEQNFDVLNSETMFACRVVNLSSLHIDVQELENSMGDMISKFSQAKVSLDYPDVIIYLVVSDSGNFFGVSKKLDVKKPKKTGTHPHELDRKLARAMINLAGVREGDTVCDPFCGTGTILLEAKAMGIGAIGIDYDKKMYNMSRKNLKENGFESRVENSGFEHFTSIHDKYDAIVTDLPYGMASKSSEPPRELLKKLTLMIPRRKRMAVMCKNGHESGVGFIPAKRYDIYRHKSLTRTILVK